MFKQQGSRAEETNLATLREKIIDATTPGFQAEHDPSEAEQAGAFTEDALSEADALDSTADSADMG